MTIDISSLPVRLAIDTGVLIRWANPGRADDQLSHELVEECLRTGRTILVATPSYAEFMRFNPTTSPPKHKSVNIVSFDEAAARLLAQSWPSTVIHSASESEGTPKSILKYDLMILACAIRHKAGLLLSLDEKMISRSREAGLNAGTPSSFGPRQLSIDVTRRS